MLPRVMNKLTVCVYPIASILPEVIIKLNSVQLQLQLQAWTELGNINYIVYIGIHVNMCQQWRVWLGWANFDWVSDRIKTRDA